MVVYVIRFLFVEGCFWCSVTVPVVILVVTDRNDYAVITDTRKEKTTFGRKTLLVRYSLYVFLKIYIERSSCGDRW